MGPKVVDENRLPSIPEDVNSDEDLKFLTGQLGEFGKYQLFQHLLHCFVWLIAALHLMGFVFVFPIMEHRCHIPQIDGNWSSELLLKNYIPTTTSGKLASCSKFLDPNNDNRTIPCGKDGYVYSSENYASSRVIGWDMVCEREWMRALLQTIFIIGSLIGAFVGGALADQFGRKPVLFYSGVLAFFCGLGAVFLDNYYVAAVCMLFYGVFGSGAATGPSLALTMELVGPSKRTICGSALTFAFGLGGILVAGIAYLLAINARMLHLTYVCCSLLLFANWWLVDESISWLWDQGKYEEAITILKKAAKMNGIKLTFPEGMRRSSIIRRISTLTQIQLMLKYKPKKVAGILDVFRTPEIRKRTMVIMFTWFSGGLSYFGLSFNSVNLFGNPFLIFILSCLAEFPSVPISILLMPKLGYKPMLWVSVLLPGLTCVVIAFIPRDIISTSIAMLAKVSATVMFNIANAYTAELFPTSVRNTAMGLCLMATRVGASLIPQIYLLAVISDKLPDLIIGVAGILAGVGVLLFLPETMNRPIPQSILDVENYKKGKEKRKQSANNNVVGDQEDCVTLL